MGKKIYIFTLLFILFFTFVAYFPVTHGFFQNDEWRTIGHYLSGGENLLTIFMPNVSHYTPLANVFYFLYSSIFQLNFFWHALFSILAHLIVVSLLFVFFSILFKNRILAFFSSLLFAIGASGHQATSWIATDINTHGSTIFGILALIVLYRFNKIWLSIIFLIISLLFKEITIVFFILLPLMVYIFDNKKFIKNWLNYVKIILVGFIYLIFRFSMLFFQRTNIEDRVVLETQSVSDVVHNMLSFPVKIFAQSLIPSNQLLSLARQITKFLPSSLTGLYGTTAFDIFTENTSLQILNLLIFLVCAFLLVYVTKKSKNKLMKKVVIFGFIFVILNSFIYALSPGRFGSIPVVDSRNIYLPSIGAVLFLVSVVYLLLEKRITKILLVIVLFIVLNIFWLEKELKFLAERGTERKNILYQIKKAYPDLPPKVVFYMVSDSPFYGLPESERIFPFETNLGNIIMVLYQKTEDYPAELVDLPDYLFGMTKEGYKEIDGRGFGYFRNWDLFIQAIEDNNLSGDSVIAFSYHFSNKSVEDITLQTRKEIGIEVIKKLNE